MIPSLRSPASTQRLKRHGSKREGGNASPVEESPDTMSAQVHIGSTPADEKPGRALLDAIACVHPLALLVDSKGQVVWLSDRFANLCSEGSSVIGRNLREALPMLSHPEQSFEMLQQLT
ncbi:MAG: hypothetical protein E2O69_08355, partial [Deltaproteobacteria bacterium]